MGLVVIISAGVMLLLSSLQLAAMVHGGRGTSLLPLWFDRFTLPDTLVEVYGSPPRGGCGQRVEQGQVCINDMYTVLSNGIIPESFNMSSDNWAEEFFTMSVTSSSIEIGFQLVEPAVVQEVHIFPLICPRLGLGVSNITLYGVYSYIVYGFNVNDAIQLGNTSVTGNDSECGITEITIIISLDDPQDAEFQTLFLVFDFDTYPNIIWLFIGEVQFFNHSIPTSTTASTSTTSLLELSSSTTATSSSTSLTGAAATSPAGPTASPTPAGSTVSPSESSGGGGGNAGAIAGGVVVGLVFTAALTATIIVIAFLVKRRARAAKNTALAEETVYEDMDNMKVDHQADAIATELNEAYGHATAGTTRTEQVTVSSQEEGYETVDSAGLDDHYATIAENPNGVQYETVVPVV